MEILLVLGFILVMAKVFGEIFERFKFPAILGELFVGIIFGPQMLGYIQLNSLLETLSEVGLIFLLFIIGYEKVSIQKFSTVMRNALPITFFGAVVPFMGGFILSYLLGMGTLASLFIGTALSATSIAVSARTLLDLDYLTTPIGTTIIAVAVLDDIASIMMLIFLGTMVGGFSSSALAGTIFQIIIFLIVVLLIRKYILGWVARILDGFKVREATTGIILGIILGFSYFAQKLGVSEIIGAFIIGLLFSEIPLFRSTTTLEKLKGISHGLFIPFFFVYLGALFDFHLIIRDPETIRFAGLLIVVLIVVQILGGFMGGKLVRFSNRESLMVGVVLIPRNELLLVITSAGLTVGAFGNEILSSMILLVMVTTVLTPILLRRIIIYPAEGDKYMN